MTEPWWGREWPQLYGLCWWQWREPIEGWQ